MITFSRVIFRLRRPNNCPLSRSSGSCNLIQASEQSSFLGNGTHFSSTDCVLCNLYAFEASIFLRFANGIFWNQLGAIFSFILGRHTFFEPVRGLNQFENDLFDEFTEGQLSFSKVGPGCLGGGDGWGSPASDLSHRTLDLLAAAGVQVLEPGPLMRQLKTVVGFRKRISHPKLSHFVRKVILLFFLSFHYFFSLFRFTNIFRFPTQPFIWNVSQEL